jgi:DNA-binding HxlR family transcriptional regulator
MKRYGQVCSLARGLDVVGDRWNLLIVRELLMGPRRYTDLQAGLPGIGTNVLAARLKDLAAAGVVAQHTLPAPTPAVLYELTPAGLALRPAIQALQRWGAEHGLPPEPNDAVRVSWVLGSAAGTSTPVADAGTVCALQVDDEAFVLTAAATGFSVTRGPAPEAAATVVLDRAAFLQLAIGRTDVRTALRAAEVHGDVAVATDFLAAIAGSVLGGRPPGPPAPARSTRDPAKQSGSKRPAARATRAR